MKSAYPAHWCPKRYHSTFIITLHYYANTAYYYMSACLDIAYTSSKHVWLFSWTERWPSRPENLPKSRVQLLGLTRLCHLHYHLPDSLASSKPCY